MTSVVAGEKPSFLKDEMLITSDEADYIVEKLRPFDIEQVGSSEWLAQHEAIEKLNLQAHYNAMTHSDDFVMGALISHDKLGVLIHELLVIEIWMQNIFSRIIKSASSSTSTVSLSLTIHHEGSISNLLEVILYHQDACEAIGSDLLLELADFCYRKLLYLNTRAKDDAKFKEKKAEELINMSIEEEFEEKAACARFQASMCGLTVLRYLTDYINILPLCIMARLIDKHDIIMSLIPLIENAPWKRERLKGEKIVIEKYKEGRWSEVPKEDHFKVTKSDAQVLQEIALSVKPKDIEKNLSSLILEQVPVLRETLLSKRNWDHIAKTQLLMTFSESDSSADYIQEILRMFQFGESMEAPKCAACGAKAMHRCSRCKFEWYCGKACQKKVWTYHKKLCDIMKDQL